MAFAPYWGNVTPFVLKRSSQFLPAAPYDVSERKYAADYYEIKLIGVTHDEGLRVGACFGGLALSSSVASGLGFASASSAFAMAPASTVTMFFS